MWWDILRYPADDARAQVFWRRRVSVLASLAVVGLLLAVLVVQRGLGGAPVQRTAAERDVAATPPATAALPPSPAPTAGGGGGTVGGSPDGAARPAPVATDPANTCAPGTMALRVAPDATSYPAGRQPVLTLTVVDVGTASCTIDLGTTSTVFTVLSASRPVWTSNACQAPTARKVRLTPSAARVLQLTWNRTVGSGGCTAPSPAAGSGEYEVVARLGDSAVYGGAFTLG